MATAAIVKLLLWISLLFLSGSLQLCIEEERQALLSVRSGFPDVDSRLSPWKGNECCSWEAVGCNNITGHVIKLNFSISYLWYDGTSIFNRSEVNPSMFYLKHLEYLDISGNNLSDHQIPSSIGSSLTQLQHLDLSWCGFKGEIPYQLGNLSHLRHFDLSINQISGKIPASLVHLRNLQFLDLSDNNISGEIPENIGNLRNLETLYLEYNHIEGVIPKSIGNLAALLLLDLSSNHLVGDITEAHFVNLTNLNGIDISDNYLSVNVSQDWLSPFQAHIIRMRSCELGPRFPPWLRNQTSLYELDISNNGISDAFPDRFWSLCLSNMDLNVSHNNMRGMLPHSLECFKYISYLDLSYNNFEGFIPRMLGEFSISNLFLSNNKLNGSIPSSICTNGALEIMNLADNDLSEILPDCWGNASSLMIIDVSNNKLSGSIPKKHLGF